MQEAFVTGSRKYGAATRSSDIDLVVLVSTEDLKRLQTADEDGKWERMEVSQQMPTSDNGTQPDSLSLRFGNLNLIATSNPVNYRVWREGTEQLVAQAATDPSGSLPRAVAVELFKKLRQEAGL